MTYKPYHHPHHLYFVTGTIINWIPIFNDLRYASICLDALSWHRNQNRLKLFAFVIMPTHIHWISCPIQPFTINENIQSFSSFTAHKILDTVKKCEHKIYIKEFSKNAKPGKNHRIWLSSQAKNI